MEQNIDLKSVEKKAYQIIQSDGLDCMVFGVSIALIAIFLFNHKHGWAFVFGVGINTWYWMKNAFRKRFTYPRVGYARFPSSKRGTNILAGIIGTAVVLLFGILLMVSWLNWLLPVYVGTVFAAVYLGVAIKYGHVLNYIYAALFLVGGIVGLVYVYQGNNPGKVAAMQLWSMAIILVSVGLMQFVSFLYKYPKAGKEVPDGGGN